MSTLILLFSLFSQGQNPALAQGTHAAQDSVQAAPTMRYRGVDQLLAKFDAQARADGLLASK